MAPKARNNLRIKFFNLGQVLFYFGAKKNLFWREFFRQHTCDENHNTFTCFLHIRICSDKGDMLRNDATTNECYA